MKKWVTLAFLCLAFFFYMSDRQLFGLLVPLIQDETGLSKLQIGFVDTFLYWTVALMMPVSGFAGDRWPRTRVISVAILGWGALTLATGFMGGLVGFILVRSIACTSVQTFYAPSALAEFGSWRWVYFLFGGATILVGFAFAAVFWRDGRMSISTQKKSIAAGMRAFFCNPAALCAGAGYVALIFAANACMSWAPTFIAEKFSLDVGTVGKGVMFGPNLAAMVAVLGAGFVTDFFVRRFPRFRLGLQIAALLAAVPLFAVFVDVVPAESRASAVGFVNVFAYVIGSFAPVLFGFISHRWGVRGFEVGFASLGAVLVVAASMMAFSYFKLFERYRVERGDV